MSRLDHLPPDQRAALSLLLRQSKSYAEVAALLSIQERAVHDRAHAALAVLAPRQARELTAARRERIGDYLLGQQSSLADRLQTRTYLEGSAPGRAWANAISGELAPLAATPLPEIPGGDGPPQADAQHAGDGPVSPRTSIAGPSRVHSPTSLPSSRRGGAVLLAAIAAAVIIAVILIAGGGSSHSHSAASKSAGSSTAPASASSKTSTTGGPTEDKRLTLSSPGHGKAVGVVEILSEGSKYAFYIAAEHLPPSKGFFYAVWLYNSPTSREALSRSPAVGSNGRLQGGALLPANAGEYHTILLTRETSERPSRPGLVVLSGAFALH